ncbi:MAG: DNA-processing protein DprA [Selenomonadaceae bacterium]|nr:DNA-processing protein DprA [Selenomonadaceae bacterium]
MTIMNNFAVTEKFFLAALGGAYGLGNKSIASLVNFFGNAKAVWTADVADLQNADVRKSSLEAFINYRADNSDAPEKLIEYCDRHKISVCSIFDEDYPPLLKEIDSPPVFFYYRGQLQPLAERIAVVGSRNNSDYGQGVALEFSEQFAAVGLTVVSGAAKGIDTFAHRGALKAGRTVAVLGCGLTCKLSRDREQLIEQIAESGVVISEFNPQSSPTQGTLVARNRIIAGLCRGLVVVEASEKSGALIAADCAKKYGRAVFAVPGSIRSDTSAGCNNLIRNGAIPATSADNVLEDKNNV